MTHRPGLNEIDPEQIPGRPKPTYQQLLSTDTHPPAAVLRDLSFREIGSGPVPVERYVSAACFEREIERMWMKVWQMACREEEIGRPGDQMVYDIVDRSVLLTRAPDGRIRAFVNTCPHRGRKLRTEPGNAAHVRCAFHGWTWNLDGSIRSVPCRWDFPHLDDQDLRLVELRVGCWGGFVFVNFDPDCMPLEEYLEVLPAHFAAWRLEDCYKAVHLAGVIRCNWKVAQEAFMESYHVIATHPQILPFFADSNAQYDIYGDHVNRNLAAFGAPSPHLSGSGKAKGTDDEIVRGMLAMWGHRNSPDLKDRDAVDARRTLGAHARAAFTRAFGMDHSQVSDAEVLDAIVYNVFPNFAPWGGFAPNIVYRWRPNGLDVHSCVMEVMILKRCPADAPRPEPVTVRWIGEGEPWSDAPELPILGPVIDQDISNMAVVQDGLRNSANGKVELASYEEIRIRHFHATLGKYLGT